MDVLLGNQGSFQPDSLPEVVESVSLAQKQQTNEIEQHQAILADLQNQLIKEQNHIDSLKDELKNCLRKICLCQEDSTNEKTHCLELQEAISGMVQNNAELKQELVQREGDWENDTRLYQKYRDKMMCFENSVQKLESESDYYKELEQQTSVVKDLEKKRDSLVAEVVTDRDSGELVAKLRLEEEAYQLQIIKAELQQASNKLQQEVSKEVSKQASLKQDIEVLQKRNQAQLTRLKCQLKEAQLRNWQWSQEAGQLEAQLEVLTNKAQS